MSLLSLFSSSPRSTDWPASLADVRVEIVIEDLTERGNGTRDYARAGITVVLHHARGRAIERRDVAVEVNGHPLEFRVGTGNYYDRHPYYRLPAESALQVTAATTYRFVLVTPDRQRHPLAAVTTPAALTLGQFTWPEQPPSGPVTLTWRDLAEPVQATVYRSHRWRESEQVTVNEAGSTNDPAALQRELGGGLFRRRSGEWTVPAAYLQPEGARTLSALAVELCVSHPGRIERTFARTSSIRADRRLTLRMDVPE